MSHVTDLRCFSQKIPILEQRIGTKELNCREIGLRNPPHGGGEGSRIRVIRVTPRRGYLSGEDPNITGDDQSPGSDGLDRGRLTRLSRRIATSVTWPITSIPPGKGNEIGFWCDAG